MPSMVSVADARARARRRVEQDQRAWAASGGSEVALEIALHPPTEREALADQRSAIAWAQSWRGVGDADIRWGSRQWASIGAQEVPERCVLRGADAIASFAGPAAARDWKSLRDRATRLRADFEAGAALAAAVRTHGRALAALPDAGFETLLAVVGWLVTHPASGSRIRQLPIRGIDTKWLEQHRALVEALHSAVSGRESLGLRAAPPLVRVRVLDPTLRPGALIDITAPVDELARLEIAPRTVFVFENLETVLSMPDLPGAVVVHGGGYAANRLARIPWIGSGRVVYWGDLDSDGFAILHALRSGVADVTSVLMDEATLLAYRDLWVPETRPATGFYPTLTRTEMRALDRIRSEGDVRLEQERIPWAVALSALLAEHHGVPGEMRPSG